MENVNWDKVISDFMSILAIGVFLSLFGLLMKTIINIFQ